jgi:ribonuclease HII
MLAMKRAVGGLSTKPDFVKVDGNRCPDWLYPSECIIKGDSLIAEISAASIIAKVTRDEEMKALHLRYPEYGFDKHKGYPTKEHMAKLEEHGPLKEYRLSFKPVSLALERHQGVIR